MIKSEIIELLKDKQENENIDDILKGTDFAKSMQSIDNFKGLVATNQDYKSFMDSEKDKHHSKALDTWKQNNLQKLIDAEVQKVTGKNETSEQKAAREALEKAAALEKRLNKSESMLKFKDVLNTKNIPSKMIDFLISDDDEVTTANITLFEECMKTYVDNGVNSRLGDSSYTPPSDKKPLQTQYNDLLNNDNLTAEEAMEYFQNRKDD